MKSIMAVKTMKAVLLGLVAVSGCITSHTLKYGFLPGSDYEFYPLTRPIDLKGRRFHYVFYDKRLEELQAKCSDLEPEKDSELEGELGYRYFISYFRAMTDSCLGKVDSTAPDTVRVDLQVLRPKLTGFISVTVHGIVQFAVHSADAQRVYCSDMKDGDPDSPYGTFSLATRKSAMRAMMGASCRRAIQQYFEEVSQSTERDSSKHKGG